MKQVMISQPYHVELRDVPPPIPGAGEVLLRVLLGGICGSDMGVYRGTFAYGSYPRVPGHELACEVVRPGSGVTGWSPGDLVAVNPYFNCGWCYSCRRGLVNCCQSNQTMGIQRDGGFSEYISVPASRLYSATALAPEVLALVEPFCIGYHGVRQASISPGERVLVMGCGAIGLLAGVSALLRGARVTLCDLSPQKLEVAERLGIESTILNSSPQAFDRQVESLTNGDGFDATIECVGHPSTFQSCVDAAAFGGRVVQIGVGTLHADFDFTLIQKKELHLLGSRNALEQDFQEVIGILSAGAVDLSPLVSGVYPAREAEQAFQYLCHNPETALKVLLDFTK